MLNTTRYSSPLGELLLAERCGRLCGLWLDRQRYGFDPKGQPVCEQETHALTQAMLWLDRYFDGAAPAISALDLAPEGSPFRQTVWSILCEIPYGEVVTYGDVAKEAARRLGRDRMSAQAVGGAVGHNPISIIIPCHRVVGADGNLTGYGGGLSAKISLLTLEGLDMSRFHLPKKK